MVSSLHLLLAPKNKMKEEKGPFCWWPFQEKKNSKGGHEKWRWRCNFRLLFSSQGRNRLYFLYTRPPTQREDMAWSMHKEKRKKRLVWKRPTIPGPIFCGWFEFLPARIFTSSTPLLLARPLAYFSYILETLFSCQKAAWCSRSPPHRRIAWTPHHAMRTLRTTITTLRTTTWWWEKAIQLKRLIGRKEKRTLSSCLSFNWGL